MSTIIFEYFFMALFERSSRRIEKGAFPPPGKPPRDVESFPRTAAESVIQIRYPETKAGETAEPIATELLQTAADSVGGQTERSATHQKAVAQEISPEAKLMAKRQEMLAEARNELLNVQRVLKERLSEQSGFLNRLKKMYKAVTGSARAMRSHAQEIDNALRLSAKTDIQDADLRAVRATLKQMQETYGIAPTASTTQADRTTVPARLKRVVDAPAQDSITRATEISKTSDLQSDQAQMRAELFNSATLPLDQAIKAVKAEDRDTAIKLAASGMVQVNKLIDRLVVGSRGGKFRIPQHAAETVNQVFMQIQPLLESVDPLKDSYIIVNAKKSLQAEFETFQSHIALHLENIQVPSVMPRKESEMTISEGRTQLNRLMESMFESRLSHLQSAVRAEQPERVVAVMRDINRSLQQYGDDVPDTVLGAIAFQFIEAESFFDHYPTFAQEMRTAREAFRVFAGSRGKNWELRSRNDLAA